MKKIGLLSGLILSLVASYSYADIGPYLEANLGYSSTNGAQLEQLQNSSSQNRSQFGWNLNLGAMFFGYGLEVGYIRFNDLNYQTTNASIPTELYETHIALRTTSSIGPLFVMGKLGYGQLHQGGFTLSHVAIDSAQADGLFWGLGAGIKLTPNIRTQVEYQQIQGNNGLPTANLVSLGLGWTFL
jgi:opacity protein-like surface antigen